MRGALRPASALARGAVSRLGMVPASRRSAMRDPCRHEGEIHIHGGECSSHAGEAPPPSYRPRNAGSDPLYKVIQENTATFLDLARQAGRPVPEYAERELYGYLACGIFAHGFSWIRCPACEIDRLVPLSCKGHGFCPSCGARRMCQTAANLVDHVLPHVPYRQWVFTMPHRLRFLCAWKPDLCSEVLAIFLKVVFRSYRRRARDRGDEDGRCGSVTFIQRAGSSLALNVHFHAIVPDGVTTRHDDASLPVFRPLPAPSQREVQWVVSLAAEKIEALLASRGFCEDDRLELPEDDPQIALQLSASQGFSGLGERAGRRADRHKGALPREDRLPKRCARSGWYNVHAGVSVRTRDRGSLERLLRYAARPPLALSRLSELPDGRLSLDLKRPWTDGTTHILFTPMELLERLVAMIARPGVNSIRYHGLFAPGSAWRHLIVPAPRVPVQPDSMPDPFADPFHIRIRGAGPKGSTPGASSWIPWSELMKRTLGIDPMLCPRCRRRMVVRAVMYGAWKTKALLVSLGYPSAAPPLFPSRATSYAGFD